jgi:hypothetical protein
MNTQQAFTAMVEHLRKQQQRSRLANDITCAYRGQDGLKCAVGVLIPDEIYDKAYEGLDVQSAIQTSKPLAKLLGHVELEMLQDMQNIHDFQPTEQWERRFELCAADYGLTFTPSAE